MKIIYLTIVAFFLLKVSLMAQPVPVQYKTFAKTEKEMAQIYLQLLDSAIANKEVDNSFFSIINMKDTLLKVEQECYWYHGYPKPSFYCERNKFMIYMSNSMPLDYYEHFLAFLKSLWKNDNNYYKEYSTKALTKIRTELVKRYKSGVLTKRETKRVSIMIEQITLRMIYDDSIIDLLYYPSSLVTDAIKKAMINRLENPYFDKSYLDFYLKNIVDTCFLDTTAIPPQVIKHYFKTGQSSKEEYSYRIQLNLISLYRMKAKAQKMSPGQVYLKEKRDEYPYKGYIRINDIVEYVNKYKDRSLVPYLKKFKESHPDYRLDPINLD